jgi:hypothetical protein
MNTHQASLSLELVGELAPWGQSDDEHWKNFLSGRWCLWTFAKAPNPMSLVPPCGRLVVTVWFSDGYHRF